MFEAELEFIKNILKNQVKNLLPDNIISDFILNGSKMVRSKLALLYLYSNNLNLNNDSLLIIASGELIHNASLLHDDVIDDSLQRRGKETVSKKVSPKISILCGDFIVSKAIEIISSLNNKEIIDIFNNAVQVMTKTEINQFLLRNCIPSKEEYLTLCKGKTAALFSAILKSVSVLYGEKNNYAETLGDLYGINFQIRNDLMPASAAEDIKNGIFTAKSVLGIENTEYLLDNNFEEMRALINKFPNKEWSVKLEEFVSELCLTKRN